MALSAGTRVGPYEILGPIGAGGMGEVYRARDTKLKRDVALKVLPDSFASDPDRMARFQREAEVLASLNHPNIAAIYGVEERALVMELVEGENLKGPLPMETAINYASQIALALEAAHDKGIIHRDLKPANIKITPSGVVKVLDFGLAAVAQDASNTADPANSPTLTLRATEAGLIMGTAGYMSPEQAAGKLVDRRADIWSFGVVLWELLTGTRLFDGETVSHTLAAVLTKDPDWTQLPSTTPPNVRRLLRRCLERNVKHRLHDMGDAWIELNTSDEPLAAPAARKRSFAARWLPWIAAAIAAAAIDWASLHQRAEQPRPVVRWSFAQESPFGMPAISRDGTRMAYSESNNGTLRLMLRMMDETEAKPVAGTDGGGMPVFSPDGQWLAYFSGFSPTSTANKLQKIALNGGSPILVCDCTGGWGHSWGDDGNIVFSDGRKLWRISAAGGSPQALTAPDSKKGEIRHVYPFFLPGAQAILFMITTDSGTQVAVLDIKKGSYRVLASNGANPKYVRTGYLTYVRGGAMLAVPFDAKRAAVTGSETPVINGVGAIVGGNYGEYSFSDNGILVYMAGQGGPGGKSVLGWMDRKGVTERISDPQSWGNGRLSPDGLQVANSINAAGPSVDIWSFDVQRHILTRLTFGGNNTDPVWTPDGRHIAYYGASSGNRGIYWIAADGSGKPELLASIESSSVPCTFTPDGKTLVFSQPGTDKISHLWTLPISGDVGQRKPALLHDTTFSEADAQISPDGRYVAYTSQESGSSEVYVQPFPGPGAKTRISTQGGVAPRWSRNGRELFYWNPGRIGLLAVDVQAGNSFRAGLPHEVAKTFSGTTWDVAPDGNRFLVELFPSGNSLRLETVVNWFDDLRRRVPAAK